VSIASRSSSVDKKYVCRETDCNIGFVFQFWGEKNRKSIESDIEKLTWKCTRTLDCRWNHFRVLLRNFRILRLNLCVDKKIWSRMCWLDWLNENPHLPNKCQTCHHEVPHNFLKIKLMAASWMSKEANYFNLRNLCCIFWCCDITCMPNIKFVSKAKKHLRLHKFRIEKIPP